MSLNNIMGSFMYTLSKTVGLESDTIPINLKLLLAPGGLVLGRGFLEGTQTKRRIWPKQHTDYIFTVGEEWEDL
jgi:rod shape determining protein RodA